MPEEQCGFRPHRSTTDIMFAVLRLQELGRKAYALLFLCFIDLQKACDSVDCAPLWQALARFGVSPQMLQVIRQFHDGMRACTRNDDGECSEWFSEDAGTLTNLAHLQDSRQRLRHETALECARRAIWGTLYADDACNVSRSPRRLERMMAVFVEVFGAFGLITKIARRRLCACRFREHRQHIKSTTPRGRSTARQPPSPIWESPLLKPETCRPRSTGGFVRGA